MELINESKPIARKDYVCDLCSRIISKGQRYRRQFIRDDGGEAWSFKGHEECCELTSIIDFSDTTRELTAMRSKKQSQIMFKIS